MGYPSDVTDVQWAAIKIHFDTDLYGKNRVHPQRDMVNAILYVNKTGCQWRFLPKDFPPWKAVYSFYSRMKEKGVWARVLADLVERSRVLQGRDPDPSFGLIDSQSVKTTSGRAQCGIEGGKKIKGRKRHIVTDTMGHLLHVKVHAANEHDTVAGCDVFAAALKKYPSLEGVCADAGYRKTMVSFVQNVLGKIITISERIKPGWVVLAKRWVVERTFAWLKGARRLAKGFEMSVSSAETHIMIAHIALLMKN